MVLCQYLIKEGRDLDVHVNVLPEAYWGPLLRLATHSDQYSWSEGADQPIPTDSFLTASIKRQGFDWRKKGT